VAVVLTGVVAVAWAHRSRPVWPAATQLVCRRPPESQVIVARTVVKNQLARRVSVERMPLLDAVESFRRANGEDGLECVTRGLPGRSVQEKLCRQVIRYVSAAEAEMRAEGWTSDAPGYAAELEAEFERRLAAGEFPPEPVAE
jgi:hypothetical protein